MSTRHIVLNVLGVLLVLTLLMTCAVVQVAINYEVPTSVDLRKG